MSKPKHTHVTPVLRQEEFQAGHLKPLSYSMEDISAAIISHLKRPKEEMGKIQLRGLERFQYNVGIVTTDPNNPEELRKWFDILNAVVFNGILTKHCEVGFFPRTRTEKSWAGCGCYSRAFLPGENLDTRFRNEDLRVHIGIGKSSFRYFGAQSYTWRAQYYRSDLMHAMLHAAFQLYACRCENGCGQKFAESATRWGGHDMLWLAAAHAVEEADKFIVEGDDPKGKPEGVYLGMDLNRARSMARTWEYIPPDIELRRVGLDIKDVRNEVEKWRTGNPWEHEEKRQARHLTKANRCIRDNWLKDAKRDNYCTFCESAGAITSA